METRNNIELTPEQKGLLASLAEETGESAASLLDKVLDALRERLRTARANGDQGKGNDPAQEASKPIWEIFADTEDIPEEEWEKLPTDLATQHDHYIYPA
jgi:TRAP-type C4-dicarboxylate transport system substrate-binding protein